MTTEDSSAPPPLRIGVPSRLGEMLIRQGLVSSEDVQAALAEQAAGSEWRLGRLLVRRGALDDHTLVQAIAHQFHVPVVDLRFESLEPDALRRLARGAALQLQALPLRLDADALVVAVADPPVRELRVAIERCTGLPVRLVLAAADDLAAALAHWYAEDIDLREPALGGDDRATPPPFWLSEPPPAPPPAPAQEVVGAPVVASPLDAPPAGPPLDASPGADPLPEPPEPPSTAASDLQIVVGLLSEAFRREATAVHLDHSTDGLRIRYRVDGTLQAGPVLPESSGTTVCHRLLAAAALDPVDDGIHEGAFDTVVDGRSVTCRVTAVASVSGTHVVVRMEAAARVGRLDDLHIGATDACALRTFLHEGRGVLVVASALPVAAAEAARILVDEMGPDAHVVVGALRTGADRLRGAVVLDTAGAGLVGSARALGADLLVTDDDDPVARRQLFDAASEFLVVLCAGGDDPSDVVADLVTDVGGFLVAGMLRAVVVVGSDPARPAADVHLVTESVCRTILDLPGA